MNDLNRIVAVLSGNGTIKAHKFPVPELRSGMVRIKTKSSLVSPGTELGGWINFSVQRTDPVPMEKPKLFGYSLAGVVDAVGTGVTRFKIGQRVAAIGAGYALHTDCAVVPQNLCIELPDEVSFDQGSYSMLLATAMHAVRRCTPAIGEYWLVVGLGIVGFLTAGILRLNGCSVFAVDKNKNRIDMARNWGLTDSYRVPDDEVSERLKQSTHNEGLDGAVMAFGEEGEEVMDFTVNNMKLSPDGHREGTIVTVGWPKFSYSGEIGKMNNIDLRRASRTGPGYHDEAWELQNEDYSRVFVRWTTQKNLRLCLELVRSGRIDVDHLTTHRIPLQSVESEIAGLLDKPEELLGVIFTS